MSKQLTGELGQKIVSELRKPVSEREEGYLALLKAIGRWVRWEFIQARIPVADAEEMARDVVTDVAIEKIAKFEGDGELLFAWLRMLVRNRIRTRKRFLSRTEQLKDEHEVALEPLAKVASLRGLLFRKPLRDALKKLDARDRRLLYARADGVAIKVVADELGLTESNVKVRYMRIRARLRKTLGSMNLQTSEEKYGQNEEG
jgi:RNA polymerase sigma factor (sigma-70 family)